ncbi:MAG: hypothetical protein ABJQ90_16895 [Parasphingorhabdus sp.]
MVITLGAQAVVVLVVTVRRVRLTFLADAPFFKTRPRIFFFFSTFLT